MRISSGMGYSRLNSNIERLQEQNYFDNLRKMTGEDIQSIAEAPSRLMDIKKLTAQKNMKENYIDVIGYATSEMRTVEDQATALEAAMQQIKDLSVSSTNPSYDGNVASIGTFIKGIITDMMRNANADFNGKYLFSGTKTRPENIQNDFPGMNNMPYELVEGAPTADNPSGLSVVFKGNLDNRTVNKDAHSTEVINMNAEAMFGAGGTGYFEPIIELYNTLVYTRAGEVRESLDSMDREEMQIINDAQAQVAFNIDALNREIGIFASKRVRMETVSLQMTEEITRLNEVISLKADVVMPELLTKIAQEETALQYALSVGSKINQYSLFDFIQ